MAFLQEAMRRYEERTPRSRKLAEAAREVMPLGVSSSVRAFEPYPLFIANALDDQPLPLYGKGENVRDWIHVEDHNRAVWDILDRGKSGETYLIGADGETDNRTVIATLLEIFGRKPDDFDFVTDRPGHDLRYAIDSTRLQQELGWKPQYRDFRSGLEATVEWYRDNEQWWRPQKAGVEATYSAGESVVR